MAWGWSSSRPPAGSSEMFVLGFILGLLVATAAVWLLLQAGSAVREGDLTELLARRRISDIERATVERLLHEAQVAAPETTDRAADPAAPSRTPNGGRP